jgi:hypothetical protein
MSRTDKDRPYAVQIQDKTLGSLIEHDHRRGECVVSYDSTWWSVYRSRKHKCNKVLRGVMYCSKDRPLYPGDRLGDRPSYSYHRLFDPKCWHSFLAWTGEPIASERRWVSTQCEGHIVHGTDDRIACICDDFPPLPTCFPALPEEHRRNLYRRGVPKPYIDADWNNPERVRERDELKKAAALYNGGGWDEDEFDFDFPNEQHRRRAAWHYY